MNQQPPKKGLPEMNEWVKLAMHVGVSLFGSMLVAWGTFSKIVERVDTHTREIAEVKIVVAAQGTDISAMKVSQATTNERLANIDLTTREIKERLDRVLGERR